MTEIYLLFDIGFENYMYEFSVSCEKITKINFNDPLLYGSNELPRMILKWYLILHISYTFYYFNKVNKTWSTFPRTQFTHIQICIRLNNVSSKHYFILYQFL